MLLVFTRKLFLDLASEACEVRRIISTLSDGTTMIAKLPYLGTLACELEPNGKFKPYKTLRTLRGVDPALKVACLGRSPESTV